MWLTLYFHWTVLLQSLLSYSSQREPIKNNLGLIMSLFCSQSFQCPYLAQGKSQALPMAFKALHDPMACFLADLPSFLPVPFSLVPATH